MFWWWRFLPIFCLEESEVWLWDGAVCLGVRATWKSGGNSPCCSLVLYSCGASGGDLWGGESCFNHFLFLQSDWLVSTYNSCTGDGEVWLLLFARFSGGVCTCEDGVGGVDGRGERAGLWGTQWWRILHKMKHYNLWSVSDNSFVLVYVCRTTPSHALFQHWMKPELGK